MTPYGRGGSGRRVKKRKSKRPHEAGNGGGERRGGEQAEDTAQLVELKRRAIEPLDERRDNEGAIASYSAACCIGRTEARIWKS